ncbi:tetratricopeptide repeat protein [Rubellimicrobium aerolatum]|uniref:Tetratricopeptide repeat protein n=1 Tax=Rubellimicrobium aerolatum TaxID=490979 RepID=A0ABW0SHQ5_9RHOB|nr:tetratricopeptide repeat protein [Rubellimicrobium aerolatum]MBP1807568.1 Flp pilus assembly protein TadD [Rubellimicrobium aerolatum]
MTPLRPLALLLLALAGPALAVGSDAPSASLAPAQAALDGGDWNGAIALLNPVVQAEPRNADALNLMGYALRNAGRLDQAASFYAAALAANPRHRGALEYQGELFLRQGNVAGARANLAKLQQACGSCGEERDLAAAIASAGS